MLAKMAALVRDNEKAMDGVTAWMRQFDRDLLRTTYSIGARMAEIERSAQDAFRAITSSVDIIAASTSKLARQWRSSDYGLSEAFHIADRATAFSAALGGVWHQDLPISDFYSQLAKSSVIGQLPALRAAAIAIRLPEFDTTFLGGLHKRLERLHESGVGVTPAMEEVDLALKERAGQLPRSWVSFKGMFDLLYPLLIALLQLWYAKYSDERSSTEMQRFIESQFRATETRLTLQIQTLKPLGSPMALSVVARQCYLRADRFAKAITVGVLYPNQVITIHRTSGKWAYVEFFDYVNAIPKTGWILKKYVTTVELKPGHIKSPLIDPAQ